MKPSVVCHEVVYLDIEVLRVSDQVIKKAVLQLVHYRKLSKNYGLVLYVHSKLLRKSRLKSPFLLVPTLWLVAPVYLILILAQADANFRHSERNVKEHLEHTFIIVHS